MSANETAEAILIVIKRVAKWAMVFVIGVIALGFLVWGATAAYQTYKNRPYPLTEYAGIKLGDTQAEVMYVKGSPTEVLEAEVDSGLEGPWSKFRTVTKVSDLPQGKSVEEFSGWFYQRNDDRLDVDFHEADKTVTRIRCYSHESFSCEPVFGLRSGSTEREVRERIGKPAGEEVESGVKTMHYPAFNLTIHLEKERVYMFEVNQPMTSRKP